MIPKSYNSKPEEKFKPTHIVKALKDLYISGLRVKKGERFNIQTKWYLGGCITCFLPNGREVDLMDKTCKDAEIEIIDVTYGKEYEYAGISKRIHN